MKVKIIKTNASTVTVTVDGVDYAFDADTLVIAADEDTRKTGAVQISGFTSGDDNVKRLKFLYTDVTTPSSASVAALVSTVEGYTATGTDVNYSAPLTGVTLVPAASKARRLVILVNPAGTIAAHTITLPAFKDGQILTVSTTQTITAWTITPNGTATFNGGLTAGVANTPKNWIYNATADKFFVI